MEPNKDMPYRLLQAFLQLHRQKLYQGPVQGINPGDMRVLCSIQGMDAGTGVMVSQLSSRLKVSPPFITQVTNNLVKRGLVERSLDPSDRRAVRLQVTPQGSDVLKAVTQAYSARFEGLVRHLGPEQSGELLRLLEETYCYFKVLEVDKI